MPEWFWNLVGMVLGVAIVIPISVAGFRRSERKVFGRNLGGTFFQDMVDVFRFGHHRST
jgi:hypothetical protein